MQDTLVITPTLGNRDSLKTTIESVARIGGLRVKHVLIAPISQVDSLTNLYPSVTVLGQPTDCKGIYPALNFAIYKHISLYKYVTYINDDDYWIADFKHLFKILDQNDSVQVVYGKVKLFYQKSNSYGEQATTSNYTSFKALLYSRIVLFTQQSTLMRSKVFLELNGFNENYKLISDTEFWLRAIETNYKFMFVNKDCAVYTFQDGQLSSNTTLQTDEHYALRAKISKPHQLVIVFHLIYFRLANLFVYFRRFFKKVI